MVPRHLGLINRPLVPQSLISTQESPVPLLKSQMAPILEILMPFGSKKVTQIYFFFSVISPGKRTPSRCPNGPYGEIPVYRAFLHVLKLTQKFL
jgi:hypothetical protein